MRSSHLLIALLLLVPGGEAVAHKGHRSKAKGKPATESKTKNASQKTAPVKLEAGGKKTQTQPETKSAGSDMTTESEEVEAAVLSARGSSAKMETLDLIGRLHPLAVHLPIGWLVLLLLAELWGIVRKGDFWRRATLVLLVLTAVSIVPGIVTGLIRHSTHGGDDNAALILIHRNLIFGMAGLIAAALALRLWKKTLVGPLKLVYLTLILAATALMTAGAHLGGKAVYGPDYLPF
jgi:uncharacterized membrane protein